MFAFTFNDALMKVSFTNIPIFQGIFVRGLFCLGLIILYAGTQDNVFKKLCRRDSIIIGVRSGFEAIAEITFFICPAKNALGECIINSSIGSVSRMHGWGDLRR